ncbi:MAG: TFIIB-type zinc finger domain-containing protein, partial [Lachnospiraceae bacterium]|nr:TFIIB-type zinc finger domain-containing protein [Lachnospiraceae bacterium]
MENEKIVVEQKCKNCGGTLRFDPEAGKLICDYCHTEEIIGEGATALESEFTGFDFNSLNGSVTDESAENLPVYLCNSCGAEVIAPPEQ